MVVLILGNRASYMYTKRRSKHQTKGTLQTCYISTYLLYTHGEIYIFFKNLKDYMIPISGVCIKDIILALFFGYKINCISCHNSLVKSVSKKWLHVCYCIQQQMCNCLFETDFNYVHTQYLEEAQDLCMNDNDIHKKQMPSR